MVVGMPSTVVSRSSGVAMAISKPSNAMPFLTAPPCQSSKLPGAETGFDPLYLSEFIDIKWAREAELKHGRICMLATVGYIMQEFFSLPGYPGYTPNPIEAVSSTPPEALAQIVLVLSIIEKEEPSEKPNGFNLWVLAILLSLTSLPAQVYHKQVIADYAPKLIECGKNRLL